MLWADWNGQGDRRVYSSSCVGQRRCVMRPRARSVMLILSSSGLREESSCLPSMLFSYYLEILSDTRIFRQLSGLPQHTTGPRGLFYQVHIQLTTHSPSILDIYFHSISTFTQYLRLRLTVATTEQSSRPFRITRATASASSPSTWDSNQYMAICTATPDTKLA